MRIVTVVGARPQFIKVAAVSRAIREHNSTIEKKIEEIIIHTGQHYDSNMSQVFFDDLDITYPDYNLGVANCNHGAMTGQMLEKIESVLQNERPDWVLVYGDTNSTLAGALAAVKLHIPVAHVEAGLRSFNMRMPEEVNRILTDRISRLLFCPTDTAVKNLHEEGTREGIYKVGDVMYDVTLYYRDRVKSAISLTKWSLEEKRYVLSTIHRAENTDELARLKAILEALYEISKTMPVILPLHPRTRKLLYEYGQNNLLKSFTITEPLRYQDMVRLEMSAYAIVTDSGGVQKEAFFHKIPCMTVRDETEWVETVQLGWNYLCGANKNRILDTWTRINSMSPLISHQEPYGNGHASNLIVSILSNS